MFWANQLVINQSFKQLRRGEMQGVNIFKCLLKICNDLLGWYTLLLKQWKLNKCFIQYKIYCKAECLQCFMLKLMKYESACSLINDLYGNIFLISLHFKGTK